MTMAERGSKHHFAVLDEDKVRDMRRRHYQGRESMRSLSREYGVGIYAGRRAIRGDSWAHVTDDRGDITPSSQP